MSRNLKGYTLDELKGIMTDMGQPPFRATQIFEWLHAKHARSYEEMTNLSKALRAQLEEEHPLTTPSVANAQISNDGTRKYILQLSDGRHVETVGIPEENEGRLTVCFSTQVGCPMECSFCATGQEGFTRNLTADEIIEQVAIVQQDFKTRVSNVVAMGQGEPFLNYDECLKALRIMNHRKGMNIGARRMTVSTCGILDGINALSREPEQFTLAVSLHSAIQEKRDEIMPRVAHQTLSQLKKTVQDYIAATNRRVTFEYLLMRGINDQSKDLDALLSFCKGVHCHVNLLPFNSITGSKLKASDKQILERWKQTLEGRGIEATVRKSRGADIQGACGQLKNNLGYIPR